MGQVPNAAAARKSRGDMTGAPRRGRQRGGGEKLFRDLGGRVFLLKGIPVFHITVVV